MPPTPTATPNRGYPPSPCTRVCTLDDDDVCTGCRRTIDEIVAWGGMTPAEQWAVVRALPQRER